ncbi:MAG: hypothetical protein INR64_02530 [Caulobacteraceae bacterium]|nr:hypothetical protein [Caulobacter sp.]
MAAAAWAESRRAPPPTAPPAEADAIFTNDVPAPAPEPLRPRLRLTPPPEDDAVRGLFEPIAVSGASTQAEAGAREPQAAAEGGWSWRDLLSTVDEPAQGDDEELAGRLAGEIAEMGVDAQALLPAARLDEAAGAFRSTGREGARETVRRAAPAAVRRLARRLSADRVLRAEAEQVVARGDLSARDAAVQPNGALLSFLGSEGGRTWLLAAAALGEAR